MLAIVNAALHPSSPPQRFLSPISEVKIGFSGEILEDMLEGGRIPTLLPLEIVDQAERRWQHLDPYFQASSAEDLFNIIEKLGPIAENDLVTRCKCGAVRK